MNYINLPNKDKIYIDLRVQEGSKGFPFKLVRTYKNSIKPSKWIDRVEKWHWIFTYKYLDGSGIFEIEIDYNDKFIQKL